jgi:hypothetical protein
MLELAQFKNKHKGGSVAVLGGAPRLLTDLYNLPQHFDLIGVNQHTLLLPLSYILFSDKPIFDLVKDHPAYKVSHFRDLSGAGMVWAGIIPNFNLSGPKAVWLADYLGYEEILVCGMDGYATDRRYWHDQPEERSLQNAYQRDRNIWSLLKGSLSNSKKVRFTCGEMQRFFDEN